MGWGGVGMGGGGVGSFPKIETDRRAHVHRELKAQKIYSGGTVRRRSRRIQGTLRI